MTLISGFCGFVGAKAKSYLIEDGMKSEEVAKLNGDDSRNHFPEKEKKIWNDAWRKHVE